jgi:hypothetical protein
MVLNYPFGRLFRRVLLDGLGSAGSAPSERPSGVPIHVPMWLKATATGVRLELAQPAQRVLRLFDRRTALASVTPAVRVAAHRFLPKRINFLLGALLTV